MRISRSARLLALAGLIGVSSSACAIPVGNLGTGLPANCTVFLFENASGAVALDLIPGVAGVGCDINIQLPF